ncbi:Cupredoxin [Glarea lozoyensis ATCC 20868]|uniref:Cupredoxin n=1 Tax=Glarea lozoyensis (strain ATCC 20868 / MF5171) TaxID=1116229 RepID=S3D6F6_GLAL2|nr:Cupredoxin [Glarea lozoyensis ATCC 20868]EPE33305.1 Cupredoxin [Glarea lozoyensis ATCC 20868]
MQFTTVVLSALSVVGALAQSTSSTAASASSTGTPSGMVTVHVVRVGGTNGSLEFSPNDIKAAVGDMVQFQFTPKNHSVVTSAFDTPCSPKGDMFSGYMPVAANATNTPTYTMMVQDTKPIWLYCSQGKHCQSGMVMVINAAATGEKTLAAYKALAAKATSNTAPSGPISGSGSNTTTPSGGNTGTGSGTGSGTGTGSSSGTGSTEGSASGTGAVPSSTGTSPAQTTANSAIIVRASASFSLVAIVAAFFL